MIIAGPCSYVDTSQTDEIMATAKNLAGMVDYYRVKLWLGGTRPDRYFRGIGKDGIKTLIDIQDKYSLKTGTEIQIPEHAELCKELDFVWIGCRNSLNYGFLEHVTQQKNTLMIKRNYSMTAEETINLYDILTTILHKPVYMIDRGVMTFDRQDDSRWAPDIKSVLYIKNMRPDIFDNYIIDCSHSVGKKEYIKDTYNAFKSIGCQHFMFECMAHPEKSLTDVNQILSINELENILHG